MTRRGAAPPVPPLAERERPGLSDTLAGPVHPDRCQSCGRIQTRSRLERWRECDPWDQPTDRVVVLCEPCARREIQRHARLYIAIEPNRPVPGCMELCVHCVHRAGVTCTNPAAKQNGGPGLSIRHAKPTTGFVCGTGIGGAFTWYGEPPRACSGRTVATLAP